MDKLSDASGGRLPHLVLVHGFLDSASSWSPLIRMIELAGLEGSALDLRGAGKKRGDTGPFTLVQAQRDVIDFASKIDGSIALVGHSMGAQIAELAAAELADRLTALVLLTPTPLGGNTLPDEVRQMLRESGGDPFAQTGIRKAFSRALGESDLKDLVKAEVLMGEEATRAYYDAFTIGHSAGESSSGVRAPTLIIAADHDPVITPETVRSIHRARFPDATLEFVSGSGHWPQIERPEETARLVSSFIERV